MTKTPSPLHTRRIPKSVSQPTETAEAAATLAESVEATAPRRAAKKGKAATKAARPAAAKAEVVAPVVAPVETGAPAAKPAKTHKPKLVRDSFTIPKNEYQVLESLKSRGLGLGQQVRKSELLRAGIQALAAMNDRAFLKAIGGVPTLKTGRPKAD